MTLDLSNFEKALSTFDDIVKRKEQKHFMDNLDETMRQMVEAGLIQHFEIIYELSWKYMQRWLKTNTSSEEASLPRTRKELFRLAAKSGLISDPLKWFDYGHARNLTSHIYDGDKSKEVLSYVSPLLEDAKQLLSELKLRND